MKNNIGNMMEQIELRFWENNFSVSSDCVLVGDRKIHTSDITKLFFESKPIKNPAGEMIFMNLEYQNKQIRIWTHRGWKYRKQFYASREEFRDFCIQLTKNLVNVLEIEIRAPERTREKYFVYVSFAITKTLVFLYSFWFLYKFFYVGHVDWIEGSGGASLLLAYAVMRLNFRIWKSQQRGKIALDASNLENELHELFGI